MPETKYIDMPPTWESMVPVMINLIESGKWENRKLAEEELTRMARIADLHVAASKTK